jgi:kinetochore protein Nuf2
MPCCLIVVLRRAKRAKDEPRCEELRSENSSLTARMFATKEVQGVVVQAVETLKTEKSDVLKRKESLFVEFTLPSTNNAIIF